STAIAANFSLGDLLTIGDADDSQMRIAAGDDGVGDTPLVDPDSRRGMDSALCLELPDLFPSARVEAVEKAVVGAKEGAIVEAVNRGNDFIAGFEGPSLLAVRPGDGVH